MNLHKFFAFTAYIKKIGHFFKAVIFFKFNTNLRGDISQYRAIILFSTHSTSDLCNFTSFAAFLTIFVLHSLLILHKFDTSSGTL